MGKHLLFVLILVTAVSCGKAQTTKPMSSLSEEEGNLISDMWENVSKLVDSIYGLTELRKDRFRQMNHLVDSCHRDIAQFSSFAEIQNYFVVKHLDSRAAQLQFLAGYFDIPADINKIFPTSLISHELCPIDKKALTYSLEAKRVPDDDTILKLNEFSNINNKLRKDYLDHETYENKLAVSEHWAKLIKCLSYIESLTTADSSNSKKTAVKYAPTDYRKPAGVAFYMDAVPTEDSELNIGTYQFDPDSKGNVRPCIRQWNELFPKCSVNLEANESEMIRTLGSEVQAFNIFCGINKIHQMFSIQVNTTNSIRTSLANNQNNKLKPPEDRCVTINFRSGVAYNHFGPFQNSTGENLKELMGCYFEESQ
jgi:hypothetical protein